MPIRTLATSISESRTATSASRRELSPARRLDKSVNSTKKSYTNLITALGLDWMGIINGTQLAAEGIASEVFPRMEFAMSILSKSAVVQAFLVDHRKFMKLLRDVGEALNIGDVELARELGATLDKVGGPHIAFEETVLYPTIDEKTHDRAFVSNLYKEHQSIVAALARLLEDTELDAQDVDELKAAFAEGLEHAEHCGTLVSRLSALDAVDQQEALDELKQLRASDVTWTRLKRDA